MGWGLRINFNIMGDSLKNLVFMGGSGKEQCLGGIV